MKLSRQILEEVVRDVLKEAEEETVIPTAALASGAGVSSSSLKKSFVDTGKELQQMGADKKVTSSENKIIKKYIDLLQLGAKELDMDEGASYALLNRIYKLLTKHLQKMAKEGTLETSQQPGQLPQPEQGI